MNNGTLMLTIFGSVLFLSVAIIYNSLISKLNMVRNSFSSIDVMLKKRYDLIPNLVATVKGYMEYENNVFTEITELRSRALQMRGIDNEKMEIDNRILGILNKIMITAEAYPELKASENFLKLQAALNDIEEQIAAARRAYNAAVNDYNNAIQMFPSNMVASLLRFQPKVYFAANDEERQSKQWMNN